MIALRLLSVLAAGLAFILLPIVLDPKGHGLSGLTAMSGLIGVSLAAYAYLYFAAAVPRMKRHPAQRRKAGALLLFPCLGAAGLLFASEEPVALGICALLLAVTVLLLLSVVFLDALGSPRRLRRRTAIVGT